MEKRANEVGAAGQLHYVFPDNAGLKGDDLKKAAALNLGKRLVTDLHVGASGALPVAEVTFAAHAAGGLMDDAAVNFEVGYNQPLCVYVRVCVCARVCVCRTNLQPNTNLVANNHAP